MQDSPLIRLDENEELMDPFEARLKFLDILKRLSASQQSIMKACSFAIKHAEYHESLFNCIIERLNASSMNSRVNLLYLLDAICQQSIQVGGYRHHLKMNFNQVLDLLLPDESAQAMNMTPVLKVLRIWKNKNIFTNDVIDDMERMLPSISAETSREMGRREILNRMEHDRERHKKEKEERWFVDMRGDANAEFIEVYENLSDLSEGDFEQI